jgi:adenylate cyclase
MRTKACLLIILCNLIIGNSLYSQSKKIDSLKHLLYTMGEDTIREDTLIDITYELFNIRQYDSALKYSNKAILLGKKLGYKKGIVKAYLYIGDINTEQGDYGGAMKNISNALEIAEELNDKLLIAKACETLGNVYDNQGNYSEAMSKYLDALKIYEETGNKLSIAKISINIGILHSEMFDFNEATKNYDTALSIGKELGDKEIKCYSYYALGDVDMHQGKYDESLKYDSIVLALGDSINNRLMISYAYKGMGEIFYNWNLYSEAINDFFKSLKIKMDIGEKPGIAMVYNDIAKVLIGQKEYRFAEKYIDTALELSKEVGDKKNIMAVYGNMLKLDSATGTYDAVLEHYKMYNTYHDSLINEETTRKIESEKLSYEFEKQTEVEKAEEDKKAGRQRLIRNVFIGGFGFAFLFAGVFFFQRKKIAKERDISDNLLLNILPSETAEELKATGESKARKYPLVTVMFTDIKNFTKHAEDMTAEELVNEINYCYKEFDKIIARHNVEKIKTMGDGYMAAGGVPRVNTNNPQDTVASALEIQDFMKKMRGEREKENKPYFEVRIGINSGPVVAGIVGIKKFAYDIWGDTVNIAARMESSGEAGKVNISGATYELVKDKFTCIHRGKIQAKNKGEVDMYFVEG